MRNGTILRLLFGWEQALLLCPDVHRLLKPFFSCLAVRLCAKKRCTLLDGHGGNVRLDALYLARLAAHVARDALAAPGLLRWARRMLTDMEASTPQPVDLDLEQPVLYVRTDFNLGLQSGGVISHMRSVANAFARMPRPLIMAGSEAIPGLDPDIETHLFAPQRFLDYRELPQLHYNRQFVPLVRRALAGRRPAFVYQRSALNSISGLRLAWREHVPFVLEYNSSEIWISRHHTTPLRLEAYSRRIEQLNLRFADLVVVVSDALAASLEEQGVDPRKILVNPNGVDTRLFHPNVDGAAVRRDFALEGKRVVGFAGSFAPFHGTEELVRAVALLVREKPHLRDSMRVLCIGQGQRLAATRALAHDLGIAEVCLFPGAVPQTEVPAYLAACDVLVAAQQPDPDGSRFFCSPMKIFEYMAMGRGIVSTRLEQAGQILEQGKTALLTHPGDTPDLARAIGALLEDPERCRSMGAAARALAERRHTWGMHVQRIIEALVRRVS